MKTNDVNYALKIQIKFSQFQRSFPKKSSEENFSSIFICFSYAKMLVANRGYCPAKYEKWLFNRNLSLTPHFFHSFVILFTDCLTIRILNHWQMFTHCEVDVKMVIKWAWTHIIYELWHIHSEWDSLLTTTYGCSFHHTQHAHAQNDHQHIFRVTSIEIWSLLFAARERESRI